MTIDFNKLISKEYLLDVDVNRLHPTDKGLFILGVILVAAGVLFRIIASFAPHSFARTLWIKLTTWALTIGLLEVLWFGLRYQNIRNLASHLVAFIILLIGIVWLGFILKYWLGQYRREVAEWQKDQAKQKYLRPNK